MPSLTLSVFEPNDGSNDADATFSQLSADSVQFPRQQSAVDRTNPSSGTVTVGRTVDGTSVLLHAAAARGDYFTRAVIRYNYGDDLYNPTIEMSQGAFVDYQLSNGSPGQGPRETITLGFTEWKFENQEMKTSPSDSGSPVRAGWHLGQQPKL